MRKDTPFWRDYTQNVPIPVSLAEMLALWNEKLPHASDLQRKQSLFGPANYFFILAGMNRLPAKGIGQSIYLPPETSVRVLDYVAQIRKAASEQSPTMREYTQKVRSAMSNAPVR